jgi:hypothetical protein
MALRMWRSCRVPSAATAQARRPRCTSQRDLVGHPARDRGGRSAPVPAVLPRAAPWFSAFTDLSSHSGRSSRLRGPAARCSAGPGDVPAPARSAVSSPLTIAAISSSSSVTSLLRSGGNKFTDAGNYANTRSSICAFPPREGQHERRPTPPLTAKTPATCAWWFGRTIVP